MKFYSLLDEGYDIVLGRKNKTYIVKLRFYPENFYHLIGLQHLTDLSFPTQNKERIYKDILKRKITIDTIKKSFFYEKFYVEERILHLHYLEKMLDQNQFSFLIHHNEYAKYTTIYADYLFEWHDADTEDCFYFFVVHRSLEKSHYECSGCSFFKKHNKDYRLGTSETKLLLNQKIWNIKSDKMIMKELYRHPRYRSNI